MSLELDLELLAILVCPETKQVLSQGSDEMWAKIKEAEKKGTLKNRGGSRVSQSVDSVLIRADGRIAYLVVDGIPDLIVEEGILLGDL
jgi:uncharacterized protein YbaR (Trm112 family)